MRPSSAAGNDKGPKIVGPGCFNRFVTVVSLCLQAIRNWKVQ